MLWFRIDNRLVHGQVIEAWLPYLEAGRLLVVNDAIADDQLQQSIMSLAVPHKVKVEFLPLDALPLALRSAEQNNSLIFAVCPMINPKLSIFEQAGSIFHARVYGFN